MRNFFIFVLIHFIITGNIFSELIWEPVEVPNDTDVSSITKGPDGDLYTCFFGIYRSEDNGETWTGLNDLYYQDILYKLDEYNKIITFVYPSPNGYLFAAIDNGPLIRSTDEGQSWQVLEGLNGLRDIHAFKMDKNNRIYSKLASGFVYSDDFGDTWDYVSNENGFGRIISIEVSSENDIFAGADRGVYVLRNGAENWSYYDTGLGIGFNVYSISFIDTLILAGTNDGVYISSDNGFSWNKNSHDLDGERIIEIAIVEDGRIIALTGNEGYYYSGDTCNSWSLGSDEFTSKPIYDIFYDGSDLFLGSTGLFKSPDNGTSWVKMENCPGYPSITAITLTSDDFFSASKNSIFKKEKSGETWISLTSIPESFYPVYNFFTDPKNNIYLCNFQQLYVSRDNGNSWENPAPYINEIASLCIDTYENLYALTVSEELHISTNNGKSWSVLRSFTNPVRMSINRKDDILIIGFDSLWISNNYGSTWDSKEMTLSWTNQWFNACLINDDIILAGSDRNGVFRSTDKGLTWQEANKGLGRYNINNLLHINEAFYAATDSGVFMSVDYGESWIDFNSGMKAEKVRLFGPLKDGRLYACTRHGVFRTTYTLTGIREDNESKSGLNIFPNPADESFQLEFQLKSAMNTQIDIFDSMGKKQFEMHRFGSTGINSETIDTSRLSRGTYFLSVLNAEKHVSGKLTILK